MGDGKGRYLTPPGGGYSHGVEENLESEAHTVDVERPIIVSVSDWPSDYANKEVRFTAEALITTGISFHLFWVNSSSRRNAIFKNYGIIGRSCRSQECRVQAGQWSTHICGWVGQVGPWPPNQ